MKAKFATSSQGEINTLAQSGTKYRSNGIEKPLKVLNGQGVELAQLDVMQNRAKKKLITQKIILALIDVAKERGELERAKAYWNTYHCLGRVIKHNGRLHGKYCKNRFCTTCAGIRKAELINSYLPVVSKWKEPYFLTLTAKAVSAQSLRKRIDQMLYGLRKILNFYKQQHKRGKGIKIIGIKSIECEFNPITKTYNPHFHIIVETKEMAEMIKREWLRRLPERLAYKGAQKIKPVDNIEGMLVELIKYCTKIFTDPTMNKKNKTKIDPKIYAQAYHNIIWAMEGRRIFERFGFNQPKKKKDAQRIETSDYEELIYSPLMTDWVSQETQEFLTGYQPTNELAAMLENNIDTELQ